MASGDYIISTDNQYIKAHLYWWESDSNVNSNTSSVNVIVSYYRTNSYTTWGTSTVTVGVESQSNSQTNYVSFSTSEIHVFADKFNGFEHAADGSLNITISVNGSCNSGFSFSDSTRVSLDTIQRYANIASFNVTNRGFDFATISLCGDTEVSTSSGGAYYALNNGSWVEFTWVNGTPTVINITGLSPGISYSIKFKLKRQSSGLVSTTSDYSFATIATTTLTADSTNTNVIGSIFKFNISNYASGNTVTCTLKSGSVTIGTATINSTSITSVSFDSSSTKSQLYALCPNSNSLGLTLSTSETNTVTSSPYAKTYPTITATVTNSNPTFTTFTFSNTDTAVSGRVSSTTLFGNTTDFLSGYGNLRVTIPSANKAATVNSAGSIVSYTVSVPALNRVITINEASGDIYCDFGVLSTIGTTTINVYATDSRGNQSAIVSKTLKVYRYTQPSISASIYRYNNFEAPILITLTSYLSKVITATKTSGANTLGSIKYRYAEVGSTYPTTFSTLSGYTTASDTTDSTNNKWVITLSKTSSSSPFLTLDSSKSYNIQFIVSDTFMTGGISAEFSVSQGVPIMGMYDNGYVTVGKNPDMPSASLFQVNSDIMLKMADGTFVNLLDQLTKNDVLVKQLYLLHHPVGDLVINTSGVNPGTIYGGTWVSWGAGKVPVGVDTSDSDFNTTEKTGGSKTQDLKAPIGAVNSNVSSIGYAATSKIDGVSYTYAFSGSAISISNVNHALKIYNADGTDPNTLQPYITCYFWKRTA